MKIHSFCEILINVWMVMVDYGYLAVIDRIWPYLTVFGRI